MHEKNLFCIVSGRVQGVFFRASTRNQAEALGLQGYAKNLANGSVEVLARGDSASVDQLHQWLHQGPVMARVDSIEILELSDEIAEIDGFEVR